MANPAEFDYDIYGYASLDLWIVRQENRQLLTLVLAGPTTGTWTASFHGFDSPAIDVGATPLDVQIALNAIESIAAGGGCRVTGVAGAYYLVEWLGDLGNDVQDLLVPTTTFAPLGSVAVDYTTVDLTGATAKSTIRTRTGTELLTMTTSGGTILLGGNGPYLDGTAAAAPTLATATTGGALAPGTYYVVTTWITPWGESTASAEGTQVVPAGTNTNTVTVTAAALPAGATALRVYVAASPSHAHTLASEVAGVSLVVASLPPVSAVGPPTTGTTAGQRGMIRILVPASVTGATLAAAAWPTDYKALTDFHLTLPGAPVITEVLYAGVVTYHPAATQ